MLRSLASQSPDEIGRLVRRGQTPMSGPEIEVLWRDLNSASLVTTVGGAVPRVDLLPGKVVTLAAQLMAYLSEERMATELGNARWFERALIGLTDTLQRELDGGFGWLWCE